MDGDRYAAAGRDRWRVRTGRYGRDAHHPVGALTPSAARTVPVGERLEELGLGLRRELVQPHRAGQLGRQPDLVDVVRAAVAALEVPLEATPRVGGHRVLEVQGHELDELAAAEVLDRAHA